MNTTARFDARKVRDALLGRGGPREAHFVRHTYRPFDNRWLYWEEDTKLLDEKRAEYKPHVFDGNLWLSAVPRLRRDAAESQSYMTSHSASLHLNEWSASMFPAYVRDEGLMADMDGGTHHRPNLSLAAQGYLERLGAGVEDLFHHALAVLHDPAYREANAGGLRMEWPRIPLPGWPDGTGDDVAAELARSAARGRKLAALLDPDTPVPGVTEPRPGAPSGNALRPEIAEIAVPSTIDDTNMTGNDFALTAGWGHFGQGEAFMPGQGRVVERPRTASEQAALANSTHTPGDTTTPRTEHDSAPPSVIPALSRNPVPVRCDTDHTPADTTFDIYVNDRAYWRNVPTAVWHYTLGGYQVLKKWLSYREHKVLHRPLHPEEVQHFTNTARRITAILQLVNEN